MVKDTVWINAGDVDLSAESSTVGRNIDMRGEGLDDAADFVNSLLFSGQGVQTLAFAGSGGIGALVGVRATSVHRPTVEATMTDDSSPNP